MPVILKVFIIVIMSSMLQACVEQYIAVYQNINSSSKWDATTNIAVPVSSEKPLLFIVKNKALYLIIRKQKISWWLFKKTELIDWRERDVLQLLQTNPEFGKMIPEGWNNWLSMGFGDECKPNSGL